MSVSLVLFVLFLHYVADFVLQTEEMSIKKSTDTVLGDYLFPHSALYAIVVTVGLIPCYKLFKVTAGVVAIDLVLVYIGIFLILLASHVFIDYNTSRINKILFENKAFHWFFVCVGFDQILHYIVLFSTLYLFV